MLKVRNGTAEAVFCIALQTEKYRNSADSFGSTVFPPAHFATSEILQLSRKNLGQDTALL